MKKVMFKLISFIMIIMLFTNSFVFARESAGDNSEKVKTEHSSKENLNGGGKFDIDVKPTPIGGAKGAVQNILGLVQWIGYAIAIGMLIYVGIKYVTASANEKAELKNSMVRYIVGALLIAGASTIANWIFTSTIIS